MAAPHLNLLLFAASQAAVLCARRRPEGFGERTQVRFLPGCLLWSIVLTILLNLLIRFF
jgi:hypothetical protein